MATGDTIPGSIEIVREDTSGQTRRVAGRYASGDVDIQAGLDPSEKLYINTQFTDKVDAPLQAREVVEQDPIPEFRSKDKLVVRHKSRSGTPTIDYDFDAYEIGVLVEDNRGNIRFEPLDVSDQELTSNPTADDTEYVTIFEYTVNDQERLRLAGPLLVSAVEA